MKIESKVLNNFLNKITIGGEGMKDGIVDFTENGLQINGIDETNTLFVV